MPSKALGPILSKTQNNVWQKRIGWTLSGQIAHETPMNSLWNIIDVRDIGQAQRLMATSNVAKNGSRYILAATDESGQPTQQELLDTLRELYPGVDVCGDWEPPATPDFWHGKCSKAIRELGLKTHSPLQTLKDTGDSLVEFGAIELAKK